MRLLIINQHPFDILGGSEMQCDLIARGLTERGHQVIYGAVARKRNVKYSGLPYKVVPLAIGRCGDLSRLLKQEMPDVIYWRYNKHHLLRAVQESKHENIPFVFAVSHVNDVMKYAQIIPRGPSGLLNQVRFLAQTIISQIVSVWNYRAFRFVTAIIFQLNSQMVGTIPIKKKQIIWNSIPDNIEIFEWKRPYCLWVANIKPSKQPEKFIQLASIIADRCPEIDFLMIGAIQSDQYRKILKKAEMMANFHYLGYKSPEIVNGALKNACCLVHTCKPEGFPNIMIQAWMQGCPTITLEYDPDGLILREQLGFLSGTIEHMVDDIERLLKNKELREEIGNRSKTFAYTNFTPERMVTEVESFLTEVVNEYNIR